MKSMAACFLVIFLSFIIFPLSATATSGYECDPSFGKCEKEPCTWPEANVCLNKQSSCRQSGYTWCRKMFPVKGFESPPVYDLCITYIEYDCDSDYKDCIDLCNNDNN